MEMRRRGFLLGAAAGACGALGERALPDGRLGEATLPGREAPARAVIAPPGSDNGKRLRARCTGCNLCVAKCPTKVLKAATLEYGLGGTMMPVMDFARGSCDKDCTATRTARGAGRSAPRGRSAVSRRRRRRRRRSARRRLPPAGRTSAWRTRRITRAVSARSTAPTARSRWSGRRRRSTIRRSTPGSASAAAHACTSAPRTRLKSSPFDSFRQPRS